MIFFLHLEVVACSSVNSASFQMGFEQERPASEGSISSSKC